MLNVSFIYAIAKCFWRGPFLALKNRSFQAAKSCFAQTEIDWGNDFFFFNVLFCWFFCLSVFLVFFFFYILVHNKYFSSHQDSMHMLYVLFPKPTLSQLFCSPRIFGFPWLLSWDTVNQRSVLLSLIFHFPHLPVKTDQVWWQYCVISACQEYLTYSSLEGQSGNACHHTVF